MNEVQANESSTNTPQQWSIQQKWEGVVTGGKKGFFAVPDLLIKHQSNIPLSSTEMAVVMNLLMHWWSADQLPHPRPAAMARRIGVGTRTVERAIKSLESKGLVKRKKSEKSPEGIAIRRFDLSGLVNKLKLLS